MPGELIFSGLIGLFILGLMVSDLLFRAPDPPRPRQLSPADLDQEAAMLRAAERHHDAKAAHDAALLRAELAGAELEDTRQLLKNRNSGARHA